MRLSKAEFAKIRPIEWVVRDFGGRMMNTPANQTFTRLFWLDFLRYVFAPKFKRQLGVTKIASFDASSPVIMSDSLDLQLPTPLETAIYYAENADKPPIEFSVNVTQTIPMIIAIVLLLGIVLVAIFLKPIDSPVYRMI